MQDDDKSVIPPTDVADNSDAEEGKDTEGSEDIQEYTFKGRSLKMSSEAYNELTSYQKEMDKRNQELAELRKGGSQVQTQASVNPNDPIEVERRAVEKLRTQYGFLTQEQFEAKMVETKGRELLEGQVENKIAEAQLNAKKYEWPGLALTDKEKERLKDFVVNRGLSADEAMAAIKGVEMSKAAQHKGVSFEPIQVNTASGSVKTKSSVEEPGGYKPMTGANIVENTRIWKRQHGIK